MAEPLDPLIAELLEQRRLGAPVAGDAGPGGALVAGTKRSFSLSKTAAVLRLREQHARGAGWDAGPWDWSLYWVRATNALSEQAVGTVRALEGDPPGLELEFLHPGFELSRVGDATLGDPLTGALAPIEGLDPDDPTDTERWQLWRALVGRALNAMLAAEPVALELVTPLGTRRYERRAEVAQGQDPYVMRASASPPEFGRVAFIVRSWSARRGIGAKLRDWFEGGAAAAVTRRWQERILSPPSERPAEGAPDEPLPLSPVRVGTPVRLGDVARMGWAQDMDRTYLVREGVRVLPLDRALRAAGLEGAPKGWIEAPGLSLTADESDVVRDEAFEALAAWLADMQAHTHTETSTNGGKERRPRVIWPERVEHLSTVSGRPIALDELRQWIEVGRELLYAFKHRQEEVPPAMRARVLRIWPSELEVLRPSLPGARWVPVRSLGDRPSLEPVDLTALEQGSLPPIPLIEGGQAEDPESGAAVGFSARAYLHRFSGATLGSILVLAYGRRVAHTRDHTRTVPGLTVVVELGPGPRGEPPSAGRVQSHPELLERIYARCAELVETHTGALMARVVGEGRAWDNPFMSARLGELTGGRLGLRYRETEAGLRLAWSDHPALALEMATTDEGEPLTLGALLERLREVGFWVVRSDGRSFPNLRSEDPRFAPIRLLPPARPLLERIFGAEVMFSMPVAAEAQPRVGGAEVNAAVLVGAGLAREDLGRADADGRARVRAQARLIVARALGEDTLGIEGARVWRRYDPRAIAAHRRQSLRALLAERPRPTLAFPRAAGKEIEGAVVEVAPPVAALLGAHEGFLPARRSDGIVERRHLHEAARARRTGAAAKDPTRRRGGRALPLLRGRVEHDFAIGSLVVAADGTSKGIAVWSKGLKVGELRLPEPLGRVGGRLWLTPRGRLARTRQLQALASQLAAELLARAPKERALLPPGDPRHEALEALVLYLRQKVGGERGALASSAAFGALREALGLDGEDAPTFESDLAGSVRRWPLEPGPGRDLLVDLIRCALAQKAPIDRAFLSWKVAELEDGRSKIELGGRNRWIRAAEGKRPEAPYEAAALVLDAMFRDPAWQKDLRGDPEGRLQKHRRWALRSQFRLLARMLELEG